MSTTEHRPRLRPAGGYRELRSFRVATLIYDATVLFCHRFLSSRSRTVDQMVQAARSGRQNIAEGSRAAAISSQTELRLVNVARASLDELLLDYEDFLRQRSLPQWTKEHPGARAVRALAFETARGALEDPTDPTDPTDPSDRAPRGKQFGPYETWLTHADPAVVANSLLCLIHQANFLLDRQVRALEQAFVNDGGYTEQLAAARRRERHRSAQAGFEKKDPTDPTDPRIRPILLSLPPTAQTAAHPWCTAQRAGVLARAAHSGAARPSPSAGPRFR